MFPHPQQMAQMGQQAQQPQTVQVDGNLPMTLNMTLMDAQVLFEALGELPEKRSGQLKLRLTMQVEAQVMASVQNGGKPPAAAPNDPEPNLNPITGDKFVASFKQGSIAANRAENVRREPNGSLDVSPAQGKEFNADEDYATCLQLVTDGMQHLDESLPNGQLARTLSAFVAVRTGVELFRSWLDKRVTVAEANAEIALLQ
jgi:hypothetical protein